MNKIKSLFTVKVRAYIYRVIFVSAPLATLYGWLSADEVAIYLSIAATVLGVGMAVANTPTSPKDPADS